MNKRQPLIPNTMTEIEQHKKEIAAAAQEARDVITKTARDAAKQIADSAADASKVVSDAAAVSVKVLNLKTQDDHDLLIELKTRMEGLKIDIKDLRDNTSLKIENHEARIGLLETTAKGNVDKIKDIKDELNTDITDFEKRISTLETNKTTSSVVLTVGISLLVIIATMLIYHLFGMKI